MDKLCELIGEDLFGFVELGAFPGVHLVDLLEGQERQHADALEDIVIADVSPVLIELVRSRLLRVEPDSAVGGLAHLLALGVHEERDGHRVCVFAELLADELGARQHVGPLVVAAELHVAAVVLVQVVEVVGLHDHIVELEEAEALLHSLLVALGTKHVVDGELSADFTEQFDVIELQEPVRVVDHDRFAFAELDESLHLSLEAVTVVLDGLRRHHGTHVGTTGGVADIAGAATDQNDRLVARHLQSLHEAERHEVADMEGVRRRVEADVEGGFPFVDEFLDFVFIRHLGNKAAGNEFVIDGHQTQPFLKEFF